MNEVMKNILSRRSIRSFQQRQIADEELNQILEAGNFAPSAMNQQSWYFAAVQDRELMDSLRGSAQEFLRNPGTDPFYGAPTVIFVFGDKSAIAPVADASLAIENMFLSAWSLGIGSCWVNFVGRFFESPSSQPFREKFGVPDGYQCVGSAILGYIDGDIPEAKPRRGGNIRIIRS